MPNNAMAPTKKSLADYAELRRRVREAIRAERELKKASQVIITSTKSDKYDRYLADVFYTKDSKEHFLNNRLLEAGLAERV